MERYGPTIANCSIIWIIAFVVNANAERIETSSGTLLAVLLALNLGGYCAGFAGGKAMSLPESDSARTGGAIQRTSSARSAAS